ncbi:hypothetical protein AAEU32_14805 [Pseudoalteromonas sp. SSDWG2]|uniref:hypothetical protein n=1 Tax=Pseudoalteromonas sp. SSDWG2 TaxID=3139391 RepID=UPI003BAA4B98
MARMLVVILMAMCSWSVSAQVTAINLKEINDEIKKRPEQYFYELKQSVNTETSPIKKARLQVILSEMAYYIDQPEYILSYVDSAQNSGVLNDYWSARAMVSQARGYYQKREGKLYLATAKVAYEKAKLVNDPLLETSAVIELILANIEIGRKDAISQNMQLAKKFISFLPDDFEKAVLLQRYTKILTGLKKYDQAIKVINDTLMIFQQEGSAHFTSVSYYHLGQAEAMRGDLRRALVAMQLSLNWAIKDNNNLNQAFTLSRMAQLQTQLGLIDEAKQSLDMALKSASNTNSSIAQVLVLRHIAEFACQYQVSECYKSYEDAIAAASHHEMIAEVRDIRKELAAVFAKDGKHKQAYETLLLSIQ